MLKIRDCRGAEGWISGSLIRKELTQNGTCDEIEAGDWWM